jgi:hypothetical protein
VQQQDTTDVTGQFADIATTAYNVDIGDLDGDFDLDLLLGAVFEQPRLFRNELAGGVLQPFVDVTHGALAQLTASSSEHQFGDVDNDLDLDLYQINWPETTDVLMHNDGNFGFGPHVSVAGSVLVEEEGDFFDYDADGDLDVVAVHRYGPHQSGPGQLYENLGPPDYALASIAGQLPTGYPLDKYSEGVDTVDVDLDGDQDIMVARTTYNDALLVNVTGVADTHAPRVVVEQVAGNCGRAVAVRANVFDNASWEWMRYDATELEFSVDGGPYTALPMRYSGGQTWRGEIPAGTLGAIQYRVRSTDSQGNVGLSPVLTYDVPVLVNYCTAGVSAAGCQALLSASGIPSASAASGFVVQATGLGPNVSGAFFWGTNGPQANTWGNGTSWMCALPPVSRGAVVAASAGAACSATLAYDLTAHWQAKPASNPGAGTLTHLQLWYRDPLNTSNQKTSLSDGLEFTACP